MNAPFTPTDEPRPAQLPQVGPPAPQTQGGVTGVTGVPAFEQVFEALSPYVLRVIPRMGVSPADVDDVAQEIFLAVHRGLPGFEGRAKLRTWVYGICIRTCASYRRRAHRRREQVVDDPQPEGAPPTPEQMLGQQAALAALDVALAALPDVQRDVFVLFEIEQLPMREIADAAGCSKFTAYARLYAARKQVRSALRPHVQPDCPGADDAP